MSAALYTTSESTSKSEKQTLVASSTAFAWHLARDDGTRSVYRGQWTNPVNFTLTVSLVTQLTLRATRMFSLTFLNVRKRNLIIFRLSHRACIFAVRTIIFSFVITNHTPPCQFSYFNWFIHVKMGEHKLGSCLSHGQKWHKQFASCYIPVRILGTNKIGW